MKTNPSTLTMTKMTQASKRIVRTPTKMMRKWRLRLHRCGDEAGQEGAGAPQVRPRLAVGVGGEGGAEGVGVGGL